MILITGATTDFGNATIDYLLEKGARLGSIAALTRERKKAENLLSKGIILRIGDFDNYASLVDAFDDVDKILMVSGKDLENRVKQHQNAIMAAKKAGVKHIYYTRYEPNYEKEISPAGFLKHRYGNTENAIKESGIPYTIFRNNIYPGTPTSDLDEKASETGAVSSTGQTSSAFTSYNEMAEATAYLLMSEGHKNKEYYLSNTENASCLNPQIC